MALVLFGPVEISRKAEAIELDPRPALRGLRRLLRLGVHRQRRQQQGYRQDGKQQGGGACHALGITLRPASGQVLPERSRLRRGPPLPESFQALFEERWRENSMSIRAVAPSIAT